MCSIDSQVSRLGGEATVGPQKWAVGKPCKPASLGAAAGTVTLWRFLQHRPRGWLCLIFLFNLHKPPVGSARSLSPPAPPQPRKLRLKEIACVSKSCHAWCMLGHRREWGKGPSCRPRLPATQNPQAPGLAWLRATRVAVEKREQDNSEMGTRGQRKAGTQGGTRSGLHS